MAVSRYNTAMIDAKITSDPVAGIIQAFGRASKVAYKYRDIDFAQHLAQSLEHSQDHIEKSFSKGLEKHGNLQLEALLDDVSFTTELKGVKLSLLELVETLRDYGDEPDDYDESMFLKLQQDSEAARNKALLILARLSEGLPQLPPAKPRAREDRVPQMSLEQRSNPRVLSKLGPPQQLPPLPIKKKRSQAFNRQDLPHSPPPSDGFRSPTTEKHMELVPQEHNLARMSQSEEWLEKKSQISRAQSYSSVPENALYESRTPRDSPRESMASTAAASRAIERKNSSQKIQGQAQIPNATESTFSPKDSPPLRLPERPKTSSLGSKVSEGALGGPRPLHVFPFPPRTSSSHGYPAGSPPAISPATPTHANYFNQFSSDERKSIISVSQFPASQSGIMNRSRQLSGQSEELIFGSPETERYRDSGNSLPITPEIPDRNSHSSMFQSLSNTLVDPSFASKVGGDITITRRETTDSTPSIPDGLMLANESTCESSILHESSTPSTSVSNIDHPIGADSSFFQMGGWCGGAKILQEGKQGSFKVIATPTGYYTNAKSVRCAKCLFEVPFTTMERDLRNDATGIFTHHQIRWRTRFLQMAHLASKSVDEGLYGCPFCVEDGKTIDGYDATVFFSPAQLLKHLDKHNNRRRPTVKFNVLSGESSIQAVDFDIAFLDDPDGEVRAPRYDKDVALKIATLPSAVALKDHRARVSRFQARDPEGSCTLQFAKGARILGIEYPARFEGQWAHGYHDGESGLFPASFTRLHEPTADDSACRTSSLVAVARWDHKVKDSSHRWLYFGKGARITNVSFAFQDHWCWTGEFKGKFGLFPAAFVELVDVKSGLLSVANNTLSSSASIRSQGSKSLFHSSAFGFGKRSHSVAGSANS